MNAPAVRSELRKVLVVAYFFPPLGGAGVQRIAKLARHLPETGWEPVVVTVRSSGYWLTDPTLERELPPGLRIERTFAPDVVSMAARLRPPGRDGARSGSATSRWRRLAGLVLVPDVYRPWKPFALRAARRVLREERIEAIMTTSSPDTTHLVGLDLARETGLPWLADFRDPWTRRIAFDPPTPLHARWHARLERAVVEGADEVVTTSEETTADFLSRHPALDRSSVTTIPNGYDVEDFAGLAPDPDAFDRFRLRHVGQLTAGRTVTPLLGALARFFREVPGARAKTDVLLVGPREAENDRAVRRAGLSDVVSFAPPCSHREAIAHLFRAHVLLVLESPSARAGLIAPGKIYECLFAGVPLLAMVPAGAASRLVGTYGGGSLAVSPGDPEGAARFLRTAWEAFGDRRRLAGADRSALGAFERRALARAFARCLDRASRPA